MCPILQMPVHVRQVTLSIVITRITRQVSVPVDICVTIVCVCDIFSKSRCRSVCRPPRPLTAIIVTAIIVIVIVIILIPIGCFVAPLHGEIEGRPRMRAPRRRR